MGKIEIELGELLIKRNLTLATAESCTGGLIADMITNVSGSSRYFERGVVTYSNESKIELLKVPLETIEKFGAVSEESATAMATGIKGLAGTDLGLAVTGIAGPSGGTPEKKNQLDWCILP
jgi:nicotinamide-nucleotide amidase